jgi:hypothetical protein
LQLIPAEMQKKRYRNPDSEPEQHDGTEPSPTPF